jgi:hypothetical protein
MRFESEVLKACFVTSDSNGSKIKGFYFSAFFPKSLIPRLEPFQIVFSSIQGKFEWLKP